MTLSPALKLHWAGSLVLVADDFCQVDFTPSDAVMSLPPHAAKLVPGRLRNRWNFTLESALFVRAINEVAFGTNSLNVSGN